MEGTKLNVDLLNLDNAKKAYRIANNAIYFNDRYDYLPALYDVCKALNPQMDEDFIGTEYIELEE